MNLEINILVPVIIGLTEVFKKVGLSDRYAPLLSLALGVSGAFIFPAATVGATVLVGVILGLTSSGLYSGAKAVITNK